MGILHIHHFLQWLASKIPHQHHTKVKRILMHITAILVLIDFFRIAGLHFLPVSSHVAEACGGTGAVCGAFTSYLDA